MVLMTIPGPKFKYEIRSSENSRKLLKLAGNSQEFQQIDKNFDFVNFQFQTNLEFRKKHVERLASTTQYSY